MYDEKKINNNLTDDNLDYLLDNICKGINADILLYFSMINSLDYLPEVIMKKAYENSNMLKVPAQRK